VRQNNSNGLIIERPIYERIFYRKLSSFFDIPFFTKIEKSKIYLKAPYFSVVKVGKFLDSKLVHNGKEWAKLGIFNETDNFSITLPLNSYITVKCHGKKWHIWHSYPLNKPPLKEIILKLLKERFFFYSLIAHVTIFLVLILLATHTEKFATLFSLKMEKYRLSEIKSYNAISENKPRFIPFGGISYWNFLKHLHEVQEKRNPIGMLLKDLNSIGGSSYKGKIFNASINSSFDTSLNNSNTFLNNSDTIDGITDKIVEQTYSFDLKKINTLNKQFSLEEARIKKKFLEVQGDLRRLYSRLLMASPSFSATVVFETVVSESGRISLKKLIPLKSNDATSIASLKKGMKEILEKITVDKKFSGLVIRGENVFIH